MNTMVYHGRGTPTWRAKAAAVALLGGAMLPLLPAPCLAETVAAPPAAGNSTITLDLVGADLHSVVSMLQKQVRGLNLILKDGDQPYKRVYLRLNDAPIETVLGDIAASAGAELTRRDDGSFFLHPPIPAPAPTPTPAPVPPPVVAAAAPVALYWSKLILKHTVPSDILALTGWSQNAPEFNPFDRVRLSPSNSNTITTAGSGVVQAAVQTNAPSVPVAPSGTGAATQANRAPDAVGADQAQQFPGPPGGGFGGGGFGGGGFTGGGFPGGNQPPFAPGGRGPNAGGGLPAGVAKIFALQSDNSLLVLATPEGFIQVSQLVKMLDILPRQVQIKVEFVTASVSDVDAFGVDFSYVPFFSSNQGDAANLANTSQTVLSVARGRGAVQLYNSLIRGKGQLVQAPIVTTTNNVPAQINVAQQVPYTTTATVLNGSGTGATNTTTQFLTINTGLAVSPRINSDDTITLSLAPQISDISGPALNNGAPPTVTETLTTLRTVRNGETMVIGGLIRKSETHSQSRIPLLSSLPLIGSLFRTRDNTVNNSELLIFVTPTIIGDNTDDPPPVGPSAEAP